MTDALVELHDVSVAYGRTPVLHAVDLRIPRGSITAVVGPSGCGKTTLLRAIAGLEPIVSGTIVLDGAVVARGGGHQVPPERRGVGLVPQDGALFPHLTVPRNIGFGVRDRATRRARTDELIELMGLADLAGRRPAALSGGQRQRVALARALAPDPTVLGLDEPFSALDTALRTRLRREVTALLRRRGATALLVTHDPEEAMAMADQIVVLLDGRIRQSGTPGELYRNPVDETVGSLFGEYAVLRTPAGPVPARPHELRLRALRAPGLAEDPSLTGGIPGTIAGIEFRGSHHLATVEPGTGGPRVTAVVAATGPIPKIGDPVLIVLDRNAAEPAGWLQL